MRKHILLGFLLVIMIVAACLSNEVTYGPPQRILTWSWNYKLIYLSEDDYYSQRTGGEFVIVRDLGSRNSPRFEELDTINCIQVVAGDTNCIVFSDVDETRAYLIAVHLSPTVTRDTLLSLALTREDNWIKRGQPFLCAVRDSLVMFRDIDLSHDMHHIFKILNDSSWIDAYPPIRGYQASISGDFSQVMYRLPISPWPHELLVVRDLVEGTLDTVLYFDSERSIGGFSRRSRHCPIYYILYNGEDHNLYRLDPDSGEVRVIDIQYPYQVSGFNIHPDYLYIQLKNADSVNSDQYYDFYDTHLCDYPDKSEGATE